MPTTSSGCVLIRIQTCKQWWDRGQWAKRCSVYFYLPPALPPPPVFTLPGGLTYCSTLSFLTSWTLAPCSPLCRTASRLFWWTPWQTSWPWSLSAGLSTSG